MAYCCSQCSFTAQFESALMMHRQLHHEASAGDDFPERGSPKLKARSSTMPRVSPPSSPFSANKNRGLKLPTRTSSATKLLGKIKARICKSKTLFAHAEVPESNLNVNNLSARSDCTSKALKAESVLSRTSDITACMEEQKETYRCHLCHFEADRITVLDRHLLNLHKIGLDNLLKLVMAKTKDGLVDDPNSSLYGIKQPYYRPQNEIIDEGEFIIETVTPKIKILKHASTNTENVTPESSLERNCQYISKEIESLINGEKKFENEDILNKMRTLNEYMCKFVQSSNALKKVLAKEFDGNVKERLNIGEPFFNLGLEGRDTPRNWERAHSEKMERTRNKYGENCSFLTMFSFNVVRASANFARDMKSLAQSRAEPGGDKPKPSAESFYF